MMAQPQISTQDRLVMTSGCGTISRHEERGHVVLARRLAQVLGYGFGGDLAENAKADEFYLVPRQTLSGKNTRPAAALDFFGGWTAEPYLATKAIFHPLVAEAQTVPSRWPAELAAAAAVCTLPGYTVFSHADALRAADKMFDANPAVRLKQVSADGGRGQEVARGLGAFVEVLDRLAPDEIAAGLVIEENLDEVTTMSVGQVEVPGLTISYVGEQAITPDNDGKAAYGGSRLFVVQGGYEQLARHRMAASMRRAIACAARFDALADRHIDGLLVSRRNYDVAIGIAADGAVHQGVLEQSWRIGGASGAEILALEALAADPGLEAVRTATIERYGSGKDALAQAVDEADFVVFDGEDPVVGPIMKLARLEERIAGQAA